MNVLCVTWQNPHCKPLSVPVNEVKALSSHYLAFNLKFTLQYRCRDGNNNKVLVETGVKISESCLMISNLYLQCGQIALFSYHKSSNITIPCYMYVYNLNRSKWILSSKDRDIFKKDKINIVQIIFLLWNITLYYFLGMLLFSICLICKQVPF